MESRKYQLQKQIIEAQKANDNDLYALLKSQWAHRFGVESMEELENLDLSKLNQNPTNLNNQKIDQSQEDSFEGGKAMPLKKDDNQEKGIKLNEFESPKDKKDESFEIKSYETVKEEVNKENAVNKVKNSLKDIKKQNEIEALIPLPPKPKYSYLKKWLLRK